MTYCFHCATEGHEAKDCWAAPALQPAQRTWVGLTDEEFENAWSQSKGDVLFRIKPFALAVEAKLKEKNNG